MLDEGDDQEEAEAGAPAWMATFSDMATLLLTFFVLLLSFANLDVQEFRVMMGSVRNAFGVQFEQRGEFEARSSSPASLASGGSPNDPSVLEQSPRLQRVREALRSRGIDQMVQALETPRGVTLRVREALLFPSGSSELRSGSAALLEAIGRLAAEFTEELAIEGHTDDRPISTLRYPSNWELSAARATAVLRHLAGSDATAARMSIAGYADTRPVVDNDTEEGRARNRRVEFVFVGGAPDEAGAQGRPAARGVANGGPAGRPDGLGMPFGGGSTEAEAEQ